MQDQTITDPKTAEEKKEALTVLKNNQLIFNQNDMFEQSENNQNAANSKDGADGDKSNTNVSYVAIKKVKMNSFNVRCYQGYMIMCVQERDGISFTALREIKLL